MSLAEHDGRPIEGYRSIDPPVTVDGERVTIDARGVYYRSLNEAVRRCVADGATEVVLEHVNGQRYIGTGVPGAGVRIEVRGTVGQDAAMFLDGPTVEVFGNAQDGVGNTMNAGRVVVHGDAGDVLGYGMRGGTVLIKGDVGYRVGIHMKAFERQVPVMVCGGKARDFFGEYMAGGMLVLLGMDSRIDGPVVGDHAGTGMHGGVIYVRGEVESWRCGEEVGVVAADDHDMARLRPALEQYCAVFGADLETVSAAPFTKLVPVSHRPYGRLYTYL